MRVSLWLILSVLNLIVCSLVFISNLIILFVEYPISFELYKHDESGLNDGELIDLDVIIPIAIDEHSAIYNF